MIETLSKGWGKVTDTEISIDSSNRSQIECMSLWGN
jgi:hypothetical protein